MNQAHVLIIEDEEKIAAALRDYLCSLDYRVSLLPDGTGLLKQLRDLSPDALLLDVMLPGEDGLSLLRRLRASSSVPVLMVTARIEEIDRLLGFEFGADDYICKPFSLREVAARLDAVLRRSRGAADPATTSSVQLDIDRHALQFDGHEVALTPVEFRILQRLLQRSGRICSRENLLSAAYADHRIVALSTLDSHIRNLRRKLEDAGLPGIESVYGVGFRFTPPANDQDD